MATQVTNYQCPACTGPLKFSPESGKLECAFCGSSFEPAEIEALYAKKDAAAAAASQAAEQKEAQRAAEAPAPAEGAEGGGTEWSPEEAAGLKVYNCPSCGAELMCDLNTAATSCPYCGNPTVVPGKLSGNLKPDYVIPFKLDKDAAVAALKKHYQHKPLLPRAFSAANHIEEVKGVYVPFWMFDGDAEGTAQYDAQTIRTWREGDYSVTETSHYQATRGGTVHFDKIPADGSTKMPDAHMDAIEPFDYTELKPFSTAYLPGYLADKYDVDAAASRERIEKRAAESASDAFAATVTGYDLVTEREKNIRFRQTGVQYALLPVWLLSTKWNGKNFLFAMNGQTGRLIGDLPVSRGAFFAWLFGIWGVLSALAILIQVL